MTRGVRIILLTFFLSGCVFLPGYERISMIKSFSQNRTALELYVERQKDDFYKLKEDILNNRLKKGVARQEILSKYGEPVIAQVKEGAEAVKEIFLYRHPLRYFSCEKIYLFFSSKQELLSWELQQCS